MRGSHAWSDDDNLICYCLYRFGSNEDGLDISPVYLAEVLGMSYGSMDMKIANFRSIDGKAGLDRYSRQAERIYRKYKDLPNDELKLAGITAVYNALEKRVAELKRQMSDQ